MQVDFVLMMREDRTAAVRAEMSAHICEGLALDGDRLLKKIVAAKNSAS